MNWLLEPLYHEWLFLSWRDCVEIIVFSCGVYGIQTWLAHDTQKSLLGYFYTYCITGCVAYVANLTVVCHALVLFLPAGILIFVLVHQRTLQKNFIALRNITPAHADTEDWLDVLMQTALVAINNNTPLLCVIEQRDALGTMLMTPLALRADIKKGLLTLLFESTSLDHNRLLWINNHGTLLGINASWRAPTDDTETSLDWKHDALLYTAMTDAIVLRADPKTRTFDVIMHGTALENATAQRAHACIKRYQTTTTNSTTQTTGAHHAPHTVRSSTQQQSNA